MLYTNLVELCNYVRIEVNAVIINSTRCERHTSYRLQYLATRKTMSPEIIIFLVVQYYFSKRVIPL